jgi:hypothetical protein
MITPRRVVITALLAFAVGLLAWAAQFTGDPNDPAAGQADSAVEALIPRNGDATLRQAEIGVDLEPGWTAVLVVDDREIPEDQLRRNEPLNQVFFTPGEGQEIEELEPGPHQASAVIWRPADQTREDGRRVTWRFRVS